MEALESIPAMNASSHILTGLLNAGLEGIQSQQQILMKRKDTFQLQYDEFKDREETMVCHSDPNHPSHFPEYDN